MTILLTLILMFQQPSASIEGTVKSYGTSQTVSGARIVLTRVDGNVKDSRFTVADNAGNFRIGNLVAGNYRLFAESEGYVRAEFGQRGVNRAGTPVDLKSDEAISGAIITMTQTAVVWGRVTNIRGEAERNVSVQLLKVRYDQGKRGLIAVETTSTNDLGEYRIFGIPPDRYFLSATPWPKPRIENGNYVIPSPAVSPGGGAVGDTISPLRGVLAAGAAIDPAALSGESEVGVFFPGTTDASAAATIDLRAGEIFHASDISLIRRSRGVRVSGQVVDGTNGRAATDFRISLIDTGAMGSGAASHDLYPNGTRDGKFSFEGVGPGTYLVAASVGQLAYKDVLIEIGNNEVSGIKVVLSPMAAIQGHFSIEGRAKTDPEIARLMVRLQDKVTRQIFQGKVNSDGNFTVMVPGVGDYRLFLFQSPPNTYVKEARFGNKIIAVSDFHFDDKPGAKLEVFASTNLGSLDSLVLDEDQRAIPGATVVLVPTLERSQQFDLFRSGLTDIHGKIHLEAVAPGEYRVFAWDDIEVNSWQDPEIVRPYENRGILIRVDENVGQSITLKLIPRQ